MKKILIYNSGGGLGDSIQLIPLIISLQNHFNNTEFFYLGAHPNHFEGKLKDYGIKTRKPEGLINSDWVLIDAFDIVIHLFRPEVREFYRLEKMWEIPNLQNSKNTFTS